MADLLENILESDEDDMKGRFLTFQIDAEMFGIELRNVMEIVCIQPITGMPEMPDYIKGIINLRGKIIPVMDVRLRFKKAKKDYTDRTCVIVIRFGDMTIGLIVDRVSEVLAIPDEDIEDKPEISSQGSCAYIKNIGKIGDKVVLLIDCEKLLTDDDAEQISQAI